MRTCLVVAAVLLTLQGCAPESIDGVGAAPAPIVDGTPESGMHSVVFLYSRVGAACTASIVAPRAVLTAKHCIQHSDDPSHYRVYVGPDVDSLRRQYFVSELRPAPGGGVREGADVAMLILSSPAVEEPLPLSFDSPVNLNGQTITAIGYGQTPESSSAGVKYTAQKNVEGVGRGFIFVEPSVCQGDSGGPLIGPDGQVWGVASFIFDADGGGRPQCGTADGAYNQIAPFRDFIEEAIEDSGTCIESGEEVCNGKDDDCNGEVDEGCIPLGDPCDVDDECVGTNCADTPAGQICTQQCDPLTPEQGCPPDMHCAYGGSGCEGVCVPGSKEEDTKDIGDECASDTECVTLFCHDPGDGVQRCLQPCRGDAGLCLAGEVCAAAAGSCGGCMPAESVSSTRGIGEPCSEHDECLSELCFEEEGLQYCSRECESDEDCGDSFHCRTTTMPETEERRTLCIRGPREGLGGGCINNEDCGDELFCARRGDGTSWCTKHCSEGDCPEGFGCAAAGDAMVCEPEGPIIGQACGEGVPDCAAGVCAATPDGSVCTRFCGPDNQCSPGFECVRADNRGRAVCIAPDTEEARGGGGGCAVGPAPAGGVLGGVGALGVLLALVRRRRR